VIEMSELPKVGIISCSGEDCPGGNISREATLRVLHKLRPDETATICLPLFLAGGEGERGFARRFPTITVDGCGKLCAAIGTARFSNKPAVEINLEDYPLKDEERWHIQGSSSALVEKLSNDIAHNVDEIRNTWSEP
jgi:uncharacterized metal-binding protein